ncbi:hypothetical protein MRB53_038471 [Persea americana]|nr:hypothetical protein MRB53_038471 [Persea americana]
MSAAPKVQAGHRSSRLYVGWLQPASMLLTRANLYPGFSSLPHLHTANRRFIRMLIAKSYWLTVSEAEATPQTFSLNFPEPLQLNGTVRPDRLTPCHR